MVTLHLAPFVLPTHQFICYASISKVWMNPSHPTVEPRSTLLVTNFVTYHLVFVYNDKD